VNVPVMQLDPSQERAVELVCTAPFAVVTGGPGTGKSTCLRVALDRMDVARERYVLASPTGKAAKRMTEATGRPSSTIHRLLEWNFRGWGYNADNPLPYDVVIIDEASMLCVELADALADALDDHTRLILVGDANQLPSVGPGRILADLVDAELVPVARLTHVHRAAAESWICRNAPKVLEGVQLELEPMRDFRFFDVDDAQEAARLVGEIVVMPEYRGAQVLAPQRNTACGVESLNKQLQGQLNPARGLAAQWTLGDRILRKGDRVIQTVNNYQLEVFNGEVGEVTTVMDDELVVDFGDRSVTYGKLTAFDLQLAYALTVHKSQGSEFPWVVCVVHSAHSFMLTRHLFYTAITRAKKGVVLVGNRKGLQVATSAKDPPRRNTTLVQRMRAYVLGEQAAEVELGSAVVENDQEAQVSAQAAADKGRDAMVVAVDEGRGTRAR
jgi:exodeoxyribonuclease V alpha subunit